MGRWRNESKPGMENIIKVMLKALGVHAARKQYSAHPEPKK